MIPALLASAVRHAALAVFALFALGGTALAEPKFPELTGRVVDGAHILPSATQEALTQKLAALEAANGDQLIVVTVPDLQGYEISDFGYQLGRKWGIGQKDKNNGVLLLVAPKEHKVRIEVGYGLEPVLTDGMSSVILQRDVLPRFRTGDYAGGVTAGVDDIIKQVSDPRDQAEARAQTAAVHPVREHARVNPISAVVIIIIIIFVMSSLFRGGGGGGLLPLILLSSLGGGGRGRDDDFGGGGGGFGGGGGGSFGGGGSSGSW
jgi:uncharacterized protein